jgi:hypothetical protein
MKKPEHSDRKWHLDKKVPIALILAIGMQTAGAIWWARGLDARISALEKTDEGRSTQTVQLANIAVDIAVLKASAETTNNDISDIKRSVEMLTQHVLQGKARR